MYFKRNCFLGVDEINIGSRQQKRNGLNKVIQSSYESDEILKAIQKVKKKEKTIHKK